MSRYEIYPVPPQPAKWLVVDTSLDDIELNERLVIAECETKELAEEYLRVREGMDKVNIV